MPVKEMNKKLKLKRKETAYKNCSERFELTGNSVTNQYYFAYLTRLHKVKNRLLERIQSKWGSQYPICRLGEISNQPGLCVVIGTIFKDQQLKPSVLKEISEENQLIPQPVRTHFADDSDVLILEDELQRIELMNGLDVHKLVTGIPCAVLGIDMEFGQFRVEDYAFLDCPAQIERPLLEDDLFIVLVSGFNLTNEQSNLFAVQLFVDWILGLIGNENDVSKICRLIIAGNSVNSFQNVTKSLISKNETDCNFEGVKLFDDFLSQLVRYVDVDILPGEFDPTNHMLPQQPMHYCMFSKSNKFTTLNGVPNPYECDIGGFRVMGSAGQPVHDIARYSRVEDPLEGLECCLTWSHLCPTAPDTLACFPYYDKDPFIISECPHIFFAGNQPEFQTKTYKGSENQEVLLICVPEFHKTQSAVLVNLKNFDCTAMSFKLSSEME